MSHLTMTEAQLAAYQKRLQGLGVRVVKREENQPEPRGKAKAARAPVEAKPKRAWNYESCLAQQLEDAGIHGFFVDAEYIEGRGLRADILFPLAKLAVEIQGAVHRIKGKWHADILKAQATILNGYTLLPIATSQVRDGSAVDVVRKVLEVSRGTSGAGIR